MANKKAIQVPSKSMLLHLAVTENKESVVQFMLKHGVNVNSRSPRDSLAQVSSSNFSAKETCDILHRFRSSSFGTCNLLPPNPMQMPPCSPFAMPVVALQRDRSSSNASEKSKLIRRNKSEMPLHIAAANGKREIVELLLSHGADINADMGGGYTPLVISILFRHFCITELLIKRGADVNARLKDGKNSMYFAVKSKNIEAVELLLRNGANVNARTDHGVTPLHVAVERKLYDIAKLLLISGADVNAVTKTGVTPLHCAAVKGQRDITEMLLDFGGDVSVIVKKGQIDVTPLLWVTENECKKVTDIVSRYVVKNNTTGFYGGFLKKLWRKFSGKIDASRI